MPSKFSTRERLLLALTMAIVTLTLLYGFVVEPLMRANDRLNRQIESGMQELKKGYRLLTRRERIKAEYEKYSDLVKPVAQDEQEAAILKVIESMATENNIYIANIRPKSVKAREFYDIFTFEVTSEASMDNLAKFVYDLQTSGNLLRVTRLTISVSSLKDRLKTVMEITKPTAGTPHEK